MTQRGDRELLGASTRTRRDAGDEENAAEELARIDPGKVTLADAATHPAAIWAGADPGRLTPRDVGDDTAMPPDDALRYASSWLAQHRASADSDHDDQGALADAFAFVAPSVQAERPSTDRSRALRARSTTRRDPARVARFAVWDQVGLVRLAVADALAARAMFSRLGELGAPARTVDDLAASLPSYVAGPALGRAPGWLPSPVAGGPGPALAAATQRHGAALYRQATGDEGDRDHPAVQAAISRRGAGEPLPEPLRQSMETRFHARFDRVRIHHDAVAADACRAVGARAFTVGEDIFFAEGAYAGAGDELLTHELTHVVQAQQGRTASGGMSHRGDPLEREAEEKASQVSSGADAEPGAPAAAPGAAASDMLLREEKSEIVVLVQEWLTASPFSMNGGGQVTSQPRDTSVLVIAPEVVATSKVKLTLPPDRKLGKHRVKAGPIQAVLNASRTGVYEKDGRRVDGRPLTMSGVRDAAEGQYEPGGPRFAPVEPPFYSGNPAGGEQPQNSKLLEWTGDGDTFEGDVVMKDQPKSPFAKRLPGGEQLVAIKGTDSFNTSAGFKSSTGEIIALAPFGWSASWDTPIAADGSAQPDPARDAITKQKVSDAVVINTPEYANLLARQEFNSVDEAMTESAASLLAMLPSVRARKPASAVFIEQALTRKNLQFKVTVWADQGVGQEAIAPGGVGKSDVTMVVTGTITKSAQKEVSSRQGVGADLQMGLNEMADASGITQSSALNITIRESGHLGGATSIPFPFVGGGSIGQAEGSEGSYRVTVKLA